MPVINGQKMACVPCIRGHRSTKCNHASERIMVPVRKPGRPLSSCPCPPGRCGCGAVRVAIPKEKRCSCGTGEFLDEGEAKHNQATVVTNVSVPSPPSWQGYRINKPNATPRPNSRKQSVPSFDLSALERMATSSINLMPPYSPMDAKPAVPQMKGGAAPQMPFPTMTYAAHRSTNYSQSPVQSGCVSQISHYGLVPTNGNFGPEQYSDGIAQLTHHIPGINGMNGHGIQSLGAIASPSPMPHGHTRMNGLGGGAGGSCGGRKSRQPESAKSQHTIATQNSIQQGYVTQFQDASHTKVATFLVDDAQSNVYRYPAQYGSWQHPVSHAMWQQVATQRNGVGDQTVVQPTKGAGGDKGTSHECDCGPGCECIGCLAHPFNPQMLAYLNNAYNEVVDGSSTDTRPKSNSNQRRVGSQGVNHLDGGGCHTNSMPNMNGPDGITGDVANGITNGITCGIMNGMRNGVTKGGGKVETGSTSREASPVQAHTPSDASGLHEEQLSIDNYFFIDMPFDGTMFRNVDLDLTGCGDNENYCSCQPDCDCGGCSGHNVNLPH